MAHQHDHQDKCSEVQEVVPETRATVGDVYETVTFIGGGGGSYYSYDGASYGQRLRRIQVWAENNKIRGLKLWLSDGVTESNFMYGTAVSTTRSYEFKPEENITSLSLWGNGIGTRLGWIRFRTNTGGYFDFGMTGWDKQTEYPATVGSGICTGWVVRSNLDIDAFGFRFLRSIRSSTIKNVVYPDISAQTFPIRTELLQDFRDKNDHSENTTWRFANTKEVTIKSFWSVTAGLVFGATVKVSAGIPLIAEVSAEFKWEVSISGTYSQEYTRVDSLEWDKSGVLPPGKSVYLLAVTRTGSVDLPYTGTMEMTFTNDSRLTYPLRGQYSGVSYTGVDVVTTDFKSIARVEDVYS